MFARLKLDGTIDELVESIPLAPDPLADAEYREVVDGTKPPMTTKYSWAKEKPTSQWVITATQAIRQWDEEIPPIAYFKHQKKLGAEHAAKVGANRTISVTLAPYGTMIFAADDVQGMLACAYICDMTMRITPASRNDNTNLTLADNTTVAVLRKDVLPIALAYCTEHRARREAIATKLRQVETATTIEDIDAITDP